MEWWSLSLLCFAGAISPGPSWIIIVTMSASRGVFVGVSAALGHGLGISSFAFITIFGLSSIINLYPEISVLLNLIAIILLAYFGYSLLRSGQSPLPETMSKGWGFLAGFSLAIVNPKVLIFFIAIFAPFVDPTQELQTKISMALLAGGIDASVYFSVAVLATILKNYLNSTFFLRTNKALGALLMFSAAWLFWKFV